MYYLHLIFKLLTTLAFLIVGFNKTPYYIPGMEDANQLWNSCWDSYDWFFAIFNIKDTELSKLLVGGIEILIASLFWVSVPLACALGAVAMIAAAFIHLAIRDSFTEIHTGLAVPIYLVLLILVYWTRPEPKTKKE